MKTELRRSTNVFAKTIPIVLGCVLPWIALCLVLLGCERKAATPKQTDITGIYTLVTINGNKLPYTVHDEGVALEATSGTFTIKADGTCSSKAAFTLPSGVASSREVSATYTREGSQLTMQWQGAGRTTGTVEGNTFTMDNEGLLFVYRK